MVICYDGMGGLVHCINILPYLCIRSPRMSSVSNKTYWFKPYSSGRENITLARSIQLLNFTGFPMALTIFPVMFRLAVVATTCVVRGNSEITVLSPTLEMSLSRSDEENMLEQRALMMASIWLSLIFLTSGPRL